MNRGLNRRKFVVSGAGLIAAARTAFCQQGV